MVPWASNDVQKVFQMSNNAGVDWAMAEKILARADAKTARGIVALTQAELALRGAKALKEEALSMASYATSRSLAVEVWVSLATTRAGVTDFATRRAVGLIFSSVTADAKAKSDGPERDAFSVVARALCAGSSGGSLDFVKVLDALVAEVKAVVASLTDDDFARSAKPARQGYDAGCTNATFEAIAAAPADALAALPTPLPADGALAPLLLPALREASSDDVGGDDDPAAAMEALIKSSAKAVVAGKGFGAGAAKGFAKAAAAAAQKLPDFAALLRKGGRFSYPELAGWPDANEDAGVVESGEAAALFLDFLLRLHASLPAGKTVHALLPGAFMARSLTFGCGALTPGLTLGAANVAPPADASVLVWAAFTPAPRDEADAAAVLDAARKAGTPVLTVAIGRCGRKEERAEATEALRASAKARLAKA